MGLRGRKHKRVDRKNSEILHDLCNSPDIVSGTSELYKGGEKCMQCLVGKTERRRSCGRYSFGGENSIVLDLK